MTEANLDATSEEQLEAYKQLAFENARKKVLDAERQKRRYATKKQLKEQATKP